MATLDSAAMLARARASVGVRRVPQGMCLNFVWTVAGAVQSVPPALGRMDTAQHAWEAVDEADKVHGDMNPPAGVAAFFGPSPTRTDRNKNAGDVVVSIGQGLAICTDANGAYVGVMSLAARAKQIQRPYLGWSRTLGGHRFSAASEPVTPTVLIKASTKIGAPLMAARLIRVKSNRPDGSFDEGLADPDGGGTWRPVNAIQATFWQNSGVPRNTDVQAPQVIAGFLDVSTGKRR